METVDDRSENVESALQEGLSKLTSLRQLNASPLADREKSANYFGESRCPWPYVVVVGMKSTIHSTKNVMSVPSLQNNPATGARQIPESHKSWMATRFAPSVQIIGFRARKLRVTMKLKAHPLPNRWFLGFKQGVVQPLTLAQTYMGSWSRLYSGPRLNKEQQVVRGLEVKAVEVSYRES